MATTEAVRKSPSKPKPKKERAAPKPASGTERLKTVVRRLPPNLPEEKFWQSVQNWVTDETVLWKAYFAGKQRKKLNKENVSSRAYIAFKTDEMLATFSREYDGHIYRDKAGIESRAVVEFAPYQKVPLEKKKVDSRNNTIDKDEDFISFLQTLEAPENKPYDAETLMEVLIASTQKPTTMPRSTPLLEALKAEKSAQKDKEAIQRNHAHYKEAATKKDDAKKKAAPAAAAKQGEAPATTGKKAGKKAAAAAQKAAQAAASQSKSASTSATVSPSKAAAPKGGRGGRQPPLAQPQLLEPQLMKRPATPSADAQPPPVTPKPAPQAAAGQQDGGGRRARPMLGLGSRQFEAALNGAGVAKPKRECQADKDGEKGKAKEGAKGSRREQRQDQPGVAKPAVAGILQRDGQSSAPRILTQPAEGEGAAQASGAGPSDVSKGRNRGKGRGKGPARGG